MPGMLREMDTQKESRQQMHMGHNRQFINLDSMPTAHVFLDDLSDHWNATIGVNDIQ